MLPYSKETETETIAENHWRAALAAAKCEYAVGERERIHQAMLDAWKAYYESVDTVYSVMYGNPTDGQRAELEMLAQVAFDLNWLSDRLYNVANAPDASEYDDAADLRSWAMGAA